MKAAVDCGTNSFRLLIADEELQPVSQELRITRLGEGVHQHGAIQPQAIHRAVEALQEFRSLIERHDVSSVRATATSAARDASNGDEFLERAKHALGVPLEILSGEEEGRLTYKGVARGLDVTGPLLVVDIGGGSTEFSFGIDGDLRWTQSLQLGSVRLTERSLHGDPYSSEELEAAQRIVQSTLVEAEVHVPAGTRFVGVAGTVTSVAMIAKGVDVYEADICHGMRISKEEVAAVRVRLASLTNAQRLAYRCLPPGRADVITGGAIILDEAMSVAETDLCVVSERDLLFGLLE